MKTVAAKKESMTAKLTQKQQKNLAKQGQLFYTVAVELK